MIIYTPMWIGTLTGRREGGVITPYDRCPDAKTQVELRMTKVDPRFPDFLGIGAQKSGTTWLHDNLTPHPDLWLPRWKEIHFFDRMHRRRPGWVDVIRPRAGRKLRARMAEALRNSGTRPSTDLRFFLGRRDLDWYLSLFPDHSTIRGEITPAYAILESKDVSHIAALNPELKVIFLMRNPVERTWSAAVMGGQQEWARTDDKLDLDQVRELTDKDSVRLRDDYLMAIENWSNSFPPQQIFIGFLDDIHFEPGAFLDEMKAFLGIGPFEAAPTGKRHSRSGRTMPTRVARYLAERHYDLMTKLASSFGGPASDWLAIADWLLDGAHGESVPYPLWNSVVGRERKAATSGGRLFSGSLSVVGGRGTTPPPPDS